MHSATTKQVKEQGGAIMERTTQDTVERTIFSKVHEKQFTLAGEAPICNGTLFQDFGYTANTPALRAVLMGPMWHQQTWTQPQRNVHLNCSNTQADSGKFGLYHYYTRTMGTILEGREQGDVVIGVRSPLWPL